MVLAELRPAFLPAGRAVAGRLGLHPLARQPGEKLRRTLPVSTAWASRLDLGAQARATATQTLATGRPRGSGRFLTEGRSLSGDGLG